MTPTLLNKSLAWAGAAALALTALGAHATPSQGPSGMAFYTPPSPLPTGNHGDLVWYRAAASSLPGAPAFNAWNVLYQSTDAVGATNAVTGTVFVPKAAWTGSGTRPLITYAVGTHGLAQYCAPSLQFDAGTDYENSNINAALSMGYAVAVTDNPGYTNGDTPTYLAGAAQGHAALDILKATLQIPGIPLPPTTKMAVWGYSQGGQTSSWAGEQISSYVPTLPIVGVASGGTPGDFVETAYNLDGSTGMSFLLSAVVGLNAQYPSQINMDQIINANGQQAVKYGTSVCVFDALFAFMNHNVSEYLKNGDTLSQALVDYPSINQVLLAQDLGSVKMPVPLYLYNGQADEFIPLDQSENLKKQYCNLGMSVFYDVYPSEHIVSQFQGAKYALPWLADRFNGVAAPSNCSDTAKAPTSTANPGGGDYVVTLNNWPLTANIHLAHLDQDVAEPSTSTFYANADMTSQQLTGDLNIPPFKTHLRILGIPMTVKLTVSEAGQTVGTSSIDSLGLVHIHGHTYANLTINSAGITIFRLPFNCTTESPIDFPINFDGPVSSLGDGSLTFAGTTTFPQISKDGCIFNGLFTVLMSGPGQQYSFNVAPPAPTHW